MRKLAVFVVNPMVPGAGRTLFASVAANLRLQQIKTRTRGDGNVLLCYEPI